MKKIILILTMCLFGKISIMQPSEISINEVENLLSEIEESTKELSKKVLNSSSDEITIEKENHEKDELFNDLTKIHSLIQRNKELNHLKTKVNCLIKSLFEVVDFLGIKIKNQRYNNQISCSIPKDNNKKITQDETSCCVIC